MARKTINEKSSRSTGDAKSSKRQEDKHQKTTQRPGARKGASSQVSSASPIPLELQQSLLNTFRRSFPACFSGELQSTLQEIKGHLYNRDFEGAFGSEKHLEAYAVRWSPSRALCYLAVFSACLARHLPALTPSPECGDSLGQAEASRGEGPPNEPLTPLKVTCLGGGGGAELMALAGWLNHRLTTDPVDDRGSNMTPQKPLSVTVVDIADWSAVLKKLEASSHSLMTPQAVKNGDPQNDAEPLAPCAGVSHNFRQCDLLKLSTDRIGELVQDAGLVTLMFTLNELYSASMGETTRLLLTVSSYVKKGTLLLVVDSPGSYSTVSLGADVTPNVPRTRYPMHWLLDHTLLSNEDEKGKDEERGWKWEKLMTNESQWFRLPPGLKYPIELEDMRYQTHLYRLT